MDIGKNNLFLDYIFWYSLVYNCSFGSPTCITATRQKYTDTNNDRLNRTTQTESNLVKGDTLEACPDKITNTQAQQPQAAH